MDYDRSIDKVLKAIEELKEENKKIPILIEGEKDKKALNSLEVNGKKIIINNGISIPDFCDRLSKKYDEIIILTDWDRKGGFLRKRIQENLKGRVRCITRYRKIFAKNTMIKTVEGVPSYIQTMTDK